MTDSGQITPDDRETGPIATDADADTDAVDDGTNGGDTDRFDAADAKRAAHATEPGLGAEGETVDAPSTLTSDVVDPDQDDAERYPASKPVPADGGAPLP